MMKKLIFFSVIFFGLLLQSSGQGISALLEKAPLVPNSCGEAFMASTLKTEVELLDNGTEFRRVKSWDADARVSKFGAEVDLWTERINAQLEGNSFSLTGENETDKDLRLQLTVLEKQATELLAQWNKYSERLKNINPDFIPLSDMDYGCDQIRASANKLNENTKLYNAILKEGRNAIMDKIKDFEVQFGQLAKVKSPLFNNEVLSHALTVGLILTDWNLIVNVANTHLVDTAVSLNNGMCK